MEQPPFKLDGIYARKLDPNKDLINYKHSRVESIWQAALGKKEEPFYEILWFSRKWDLKNQKISSYRVAHAIMTGEIFDLPIGIKVEGAILDMVMYYSTKISSNSTTEKPFSVEIYSKIYYS
jgi:hypothetical protein